jgi:hypothetical protein
MTYQDPREVTSPKTAITLLKVLYDGGEQTKTGGEWDGWSVAEFKWYGVPAVGVRWNGSTKNPDFVSPRGNPHSREPTWFVLPEPVATAVRSILKNAPQKQPPP